MGFYTAHNSGVERQSQYKDKGMQKVLRTFDFPLNSLFSSTANTLKVAPKSATFPSAAPTASVGSIHMHPAMM